MFKARSLYAGIDWTAFFEVNDACGGNNLQEGSEERSVEIHRAATATLLGVQPNPSKESLLVQLSLPEGFTGFVVLRDLSGQTVQKVQVMAQTALQLIPPSDLSGIYLCCLEDTEGNILDRLKVVILK